MTGRICHHLTAISLVTGSVDLEAAVEAERKRKFTQADVTRAVRGVQMTGASVGKVEVSRDKIRVGIGRADDGGGMARDASVVAMDRIAAMRRGK